MASKLNVIKHPIFEHKLAILRNKNSSSFEFRQVFSELSGMLAYECTRDLKLKQHEIETPLEKTKVQSVGEDVVVACILRAGEGMLDGFLKALPFAQVGHIGIYRDKNLNNTVEYYFKLPQDVKGKKIFLLDPLLATGDTALAALERLKQYQVGPIKLVTLLTSQIGIDKVQAEHPDVEIFTLSVERALNDKGYLLPGVGDAGDRLYRTV